MMIYSAGLRHNELIDLMISDIDSERMVVNIKGAKGKKKNINNCSNTIISHITKRSIVQAES